MFSFCWNPDSSTCSRQMLSEQERESKGWYEKRHHHPFHHHTEPAHPTPTFLSLQLVAQSVSQSCITASTSDDGMGWDGSYHYSKALSFFGQSRYPLPLEQTLSMLTRSELFVNSEVPCTKKGMHSDATFITHHRRRCGVLPL